MNGLKQVNIWLCPCQSREPGPKLQPDNADTDQSSCFSKLALKLRSSCSTHKLTTQYIWTENLVRHL